MQNVEWVIPLRLLRLLEHLAVLKIGEFVIHAQDLRFLKSLGLEDP